MCEGLAGGASYSAANSYLDGLATWRAASNCHGVSLKWGPVSEARSLKYHVRSSC